MRPGIFHLLLAISPIALFAFPEPVHAEGLLRVASDDWCPYVCAVNGRVTGGYLVDLAGEAMAMTGSHVEPLLLPLNRAIEQTVAGKIEGVYAPPIDERLTLSVPLAYSRACFYSRPNETWRYRGIGSLKNMTVGTIDDYGYDNGQMDDYIARNRGVPHTGIDFSYGETAGITNVRKLLSGRYPLLLEHEAVMTRLVGEMKVAGAVRNAGCLEQALPLTIGFARSDRRAAGWSQDLVEGLQQMIVSGRTKELQKRYNIPDSNVTSPQIQPRDRKPHAAG